MPYPAFDRSRLRIQSLSQRQHDLDLSVILPLDAPLPAFSHRALGVLATTMRQWDKAELHFEVALGLDDVMGARAWQARTEWGYASMLVARGGPGDNERARSLLEQARATARELGITGLAARIEEALQVT